VILFFGLVRPYKGVDVLLEAFRSIENAELWVVGRPLGMSLESLQELAAHAPGVVRFVPRFVSDQELPAYFRRADIVALPHRDAEQSGVLYAALAFGKPIVMSDVGGFAEVAETGAGALVPAGNPEALAERLTALLADPEERERLATAAAAAAAGPYSWERVASQTMTLYRELGA
jgi:glycosyltransferase involved in cell wall biosynthesis